MSLYSPFLQPLILVILEVLTTALAIGFTSAPSKLIRSFGLTIVAASAYIATLTTLRYVPSKLWASVLAGNASTYVLRYLELVLLDRWSFDDGGPTRLKRPLNEKIGKKTTQINSRTAASLRPATAWRRLRFGFSVTINPRQVNTPYQVKNVPHWSLGEPQYVPSRGNFLRRTAVNVFLSYLTVDLCSLGAQPERNSILFSDDKVALFTRLGSLNPRDIVIRVLASLILWLNIFCIFRIFHGLLVFLAVTSGSTEVKDWPPPFGPLSEAYSVRRFWGIFWHQMYRQTFGGPARFLVHDVLQLPQSTLVARYARILATFFISGVLHLSTDVAVGIAWGESGAIRFFCTQALGILLEDSVQALCHHFVPNRAEIRSSRWGNVAKIIGYVWLGVFLAWSTPVWAYPAMRRDQGKTEDLILPFSIMKSLVGVV